MDALGEGEVGAEWVLLGCNRWCRSRWCNRGSVYFLSVSDVVWRSLVAEVEESGNCMYWQSDSRWWLITECFALFLSRNIMRPLNLHTVCHLLVSMMVNWYSLLIVGLIPGKYLSIKSALFSEMNKTSL